MPRRTRTALIGQKKCRDVSADPGPTKTLTIEEQLAHLVGKPATEPRVLNRTRCVG